MTRMAMGLVCLAFAACSGSATEQGSLAGPQREVAVTRAFANARLQKYAEVLRNNGWVVAGRGDAKAELLMVPSNLESGVPGSGPMVETTRVSLPETRPATASDPEVAASLVVAWTAGADEIFALAPRSAGAVEVLSAMAKVVAGLDDQAATALDGAGTKTAASSSCGAENAACGGVTTCCTGLECISPRDNHFVCGCTNPYNTSYVERGTSSIACFVLPDNPIGAAEIVRNLEGCGCCNIGPDACQNAVSLPQYVRSANDQLICLDTPGPIC